MLVLGAGLLGPSAEAGEASFGVKSLKDVAYHTGEDTHATKHKLDLFLPEGRKDFPVLFFVHGGAWRHGDKGFLGIYSALGKFYAQHGIGAVVINYRLSPDVQHPEHVKDVARAFAWTYHNIARYGGDPGRIFVRGANLFSGYWPDGADGPDADGWFATGDIAVVDDAGQLRLVGRSSDLVIVNGFNVYPAEVEAVLAAQPGVAEVAVTGVRHQRTGEAVQAWVVPAAGTHLDAGDLLAAAARSLARFKLPERIHIVDALPRTVTGKIMNSAIATARLK